jgi:hypothetical protein
MLVAALSAVSLLISGGCASPGPPRSPSLGLPTVVTDLSAERIGDSVELHFTAPSRSTDKLPLRSATLRGVLCRAVAHQPCVAIAGFSGPTAIATTAPGGGPNLVTWRDRLPPGLSSGSRRLLSYRVEFFSVSGNSAGKSEAAYTLAGDSPPAVEDLRAEGTRQGIVLRWRPASATDASVILERENLSPSAQPARSGTGRAKRPGNERPGNGRPANERPAKATNRTPANIVWLNTNSSKQPGTAGGAGSQDLAPEGTPANAESASTAETLDTTALPDVPYRYTAERRLTVTLGGRPLEMHSTPSTPVEITLREVYPPPAPSGLTAAGYFASGEPSPAFSVDLIWQPVDSTGLLAGLAGYNVYRAQLPAEPQRTQAGEIPPSPGRERLNTTPVPLAAFHDTTANPARAYRYFVTAVDRRGNESSAATVDLQPSPGPPAP